MSDLVKLTARLGKRYRTFKDKERLKEESRKEFFEAATKETEAEVLATKAVSITAQDSNDAQTKVGQQNPRWRVVGVTSLGGDEYRVSLEEDPQYKPFVFVNPQDGQVYRKTVQAGTPTLDDDALREDDPELWESITVPSRELKPLDELPDELIAKVQPYLYEGKPQVKLAAPRKAKPEELEDNDE
jgi:hypothetical protein